METPQNNAFKYYVVRIEDWRLELNNEDNEEPLNVFDNEKEAQEYAIKNLWEVKKNGIVCGIEIRKIPTSAIYRYFRENKNFNEAAAQAILNKNSKLVDYSSALSGDVEDSEFYECEYKPIDGRAIILYYRHLTFMNYAFEVVDIKRASEAGVHTVQDLPPPINDLSHVWATVLDDDAIVNAYLGRTNDFILKSINKGWSKIEEFVIDEELVTYINDDEDDDEDDD